MWYFDTHYFESSDSRVFLLLDLMVNAICSTHVCNAVCMIVGLCVAQLVVYPCTEAAVPTDLDFLFKIGYFDAHCF